MRGAVVMVQGTCSSAGKSVVATALCRVFARRGFRVAPFKAQNMALNSFVTPEGLEIGRAQAVQAEAAGVEPSVDMNPILLKPEGDRRSQVVVLGRPIGSFGAAEYQARKGELRALVLQCLERLRRRYDVVVAEGAGSPAEVNLREGDLVNMFVARAARAPVVLVGDIDRGGVFASFVGTLELLEAEERSLVRALLVNKFRGDPALLEPGLRFLEERTGVPVLGVLPFLERLGIADEDSVSLDDRRRKAAAPPGRVDIVVARLPRISNFDDFLPLEQEPEVAVRFVEAPDEVGNPDLFVLPGTKCTATDLEWLRASGLAGVAFERARRGRPLLGICGGFQMLGRSIDDPDRVESSRPRVEGLGLLPVRTVFGREKVTRRVRARPASRSFLTEELPSTAGLSAYEIHMGRIEPLEGRTPAFEVLGEPGPGRFEGAVSGAIVGTLLHGLFDDPLLRRSLLSELRRRAGSGPAVLGDWNREAAYDRLADAFCASVRLDLLDSLVAAGAG
jgi:adenosylcobyric acid synthase